MIAELMELMLYVTTGVVIGLLIAWGFADTQKFILDLLGVSK